MLGRVTGGAKLSFTVAGISMQPSEFVKIIFVFFIACMLYKATDFRQVCITTVAAAINVLILVLSTDLGAALIFFVTYIVMLYVATRKPVYFFGGLGLGCMAALVASKLFSHVQVRIAAWKDPFSSIYGGSLQIAQSLFAIGTEAGLGSVYIRVCRKNTGRRIGFCFRSNIRRDGWYFCHLYHTCMF
ncbi:MAG: FtsW/RodA/SpoVE family cell cycle protein [Eubacterium sp.]